MCSGHIWKSVLEVWAAPALPLTMTLPRFCWMHLAVLVFQFVPPRASFHRVVWSTGRAWVNCPAPEWLGEGLGFWCLPLQQSEPCTWGSAQCWSMVTSRSGQVCLAWCYGTMVGLVAPDGGSRMRGAWRSSRRTVPFPPGKDRMWASTG